MKNPLPTLFLVAVLLLAATRPARAAAGFDLGGFGHLPVLADGRVKPLDTIARSSLLLLQGRQQVADGTGRPLAPGEWLLTLMLQPQRADAWPVIRIDNGEVLSLFNLTTKDGAGGVRFSLDQLRAGLAELDRQARMADEVESAGRTAFQRAVVELRNHAHYYSQLKYALQANDDAGFPADLAAARAPAARPALEAMNTFNPLRLVPAAPAAGGWVGVGAALLAAVDGTAPDPALAAYGRLRTAWLASDAAAFNAAVGELRAELSGRFPAETRRCGIEVLFNRLEPFYLAMVLYLVAFLAAVVSWLRWPRALARLALLLMGAAFLLTTAGLGCRMWLEGRPPVTNLYSSALFIGWGAVALCFVLEFLHGDALAAAAGTLLGFATLIIAHHLALGGDTMEMMRAVLDSNFWLSTHVVTVTIGYASTFLAGTLAMVYILRGTLSRHLDRPTADALARMVYGIVCFATFFSFVGTVLGGIWADQSWGRFWGWDPKENGALIIVMWNSVILHSRWGGLVGQRGLMALAVFGNIVTAWSWFGTNMLGVGLHSYGFTSSAFYGLLAFVGSQLLLIALVLLPLPRRERPAAA